MGAPPQKPQKHTALFDWPFKKHPYLRKYLGLFASLFLVFIFICYTQISINDFDRHYNVSSSRYKSIEKYLIHTSTCRIPDDNPFNEDVRKFFIREKYMKCSKLGLLTYVQDSRLYVNQSLLESYSMFPLTCCYSKVIRVLVANKSDSEVKFAGCTQFEGSVNLTDPTVMVKCTNPYGVEVYSNVHTVIDEQFGASKRNGLSVLFVGIDSISKMNLVRTMPKTHRFLESQDFINLKGYTKIGDNTFPNLMAILSGKTTEQVYKHCDPAHKKMNGCDIIWDKFRELGYVTAYAEDESSIGTFHYDRMGFGEPPTSYYFRPYILAAEQLPLYKRYGMKYCTGPVTSGERVMHLAKDFLVNLKGQARFGLFWMNSFSHDNLNIPSAMDGKVEEFLRDIYGHLDDTILVFFSDHGFRFGDIRYTHTGWLEERLPFIYVYLPNSFKEQYAEEYNNFVINADRLTNPFDMHMTLQDVLKFSNENYTVKPSLACPKCHSLFKEMDEKRTCKDCAIEQHWCLCKGHSYINPKKHVVQEAARFVVEEINRLIRSYKDGSDCSHYYLKKVVSAGMSDSYIKDNEKTNYFLLIIETRPPAMFEATIEASQNPAKPTFRLLGEVSRINRYAENSLCVKDYNLKKYCYCEGLLTSIKSAVCNFFNCV